MHAQRRTIISLTLSVVLYAACGKDEAQSGPPAQAGGAAGAVAGAPSVAAGAPAAAPPAAWPAVVKQCQGKPGKLRGKSLQTLTAAGLTRTFLHYAPASLDPNTPAPVVIVPHGYTMTADMMFDITRYSEIADREHLIVLFPNGQPSTSLLAGPWNVGSPDCRSTLGPLPLAQGDDQAFLNEMLHFAEADQCVDAQHVFMTGFSMGGYFANETGCLRPEIRAVAPHSGGTHDLGACAAAHKPALIMHFQGDGLIPYMCGQNARDRWVAKNGCQLDAPEVQMVSGGSCEYYKGCPADGQVAFCSFTIPPNGNDSFPGHAWSGGSEQGMGASFAIPQTESASELSFRFFKQYAW
jgi:poly(3-hydroxybutyrate) depolymerase